MLCHEWITEDQVEWCQYALHRRMLSVVFFIVLLLLGRLFADWICVLSFHCSFMFLRQRTNGYHAHTEWGCLAVSAAFEVGAMLLLPVWTFRLYIVSLLILPFCVTQLAPVNNSQIHFTEKELRALHGRIILRVLLLAVLSLLLCYFGCFPAAASISLAFFASAISLAMVILGFGVQ